jgi:hypothetical protein
MSVTRYPVTGATKVIMADAVDHASPRGARRIISGMRLKKSDRRDAAHVVEIPECNACRLSSALGGRGERLLALKPSLRAAVISLGCVLAVGLSQSASAAQAYTHGPWTCDRLAGNHCTDYIGTPSHPWHGMTVYGGDPSNSGSWVYGYWCASGKRGGGIWNFFCGYAFAGSGTRCDVGDVTAYTYGLGYAGERRQSGYANTAGGC